MKLKHYYILGVVAILLGSSTLAVADLPESNNGFNTWISDEGDDVPVPDPAPATTEEDPAARAFGFRRG